MMLSFPKRLGRGASRGELFGHVVRRAIALVLLGWWGGSWAAVVWSGGMAEGLGGALLGDLVLKLAWPALVLGAVVLLAGTERARLWSTITLVGALGVAAGWLATGGDHALFERLAGLRIPGVLVRIGVCYLVASAIWFVTPSPRAIVAWVVGLPRRAAWRPGWRWTEERCSGETGSPPRRSGPSSPPTSAGRLPALRPASRPGLSRSRAPAPLPAGAGSGG